MTQPQNQPITLSTQAFLILCRVFDGCYDELKQQEHLSEMVESIAAILLAGVQTLEEQQKPPRDITFPLTIPEAFFLRKLIAEMVARTPQEEEQGKARSWLQECLGALNRAAMPLA
jgi:hypothetical protein